jgi:hypothetical protein
VEKNMPMRLYAMERVKPIPTSFLDAYASCSS